MNIVEKTKKEGVLSSKRYTKKHNSKSKNKKVKNVTIQGNFLRVKLSSSILKFSSLYGIKKLWVQLILVTFVSVFSGVIGVFLLQNTGLYNVGFDAFAQGIGRLAAYLQDGKWDPSNPTQIPIEKLTILNALFWSLIIVINIPLIYFGWKKIGKRFTILSAYFIVVSSLVGLGVGFIPGIDKVFFFSKVIPLNEFVQHGVQISLWDSQHDTISQLSLLIYGFVYGILQALCYVVLFIIGASSGGLDFLVVWYAEKKYKDLGSVFTYFNVLCFLISYIFGTYIPASLTIEANGGIIYDQIDSVNQPGTLDIKAWDINLFFSPSFVGSLLMGIVLGITLNAFFPKYQMSKVEIFSKYVYEIRDYLIKENKPYSISIKTIEGGFSKLPQKVLMTNCMYVDAAELLKIIRKYDPNALFIVTLIKNIDGYVYVESKSEENISLKKYFGWLLGSKKKSKIAELEARQIEFELDDNLVDHIDENIEITNQPLKVIEASEVYDEDLIKENLEEVAKQEEQIEKELTLDFSENNDKQEKDGES